MSEHNNPSYDDVETSTPATKIDKKGMMFDHSMLISKLHQQPTMKNPQMTIMMKTHVMATMMMNQINVIQDMTKIIMPNPEKTDVITTIMIHNPMKI